jgi:uncharacterized RDD family membrane protein YckC
MGEDSFAGALNLGDSRSFSEPDALAAQVRAKLPNETSRSPQFAVRSRLNAIILDLLLVGVATRLLQSALGASARSADAVLLFFALQFAYFFAFEARTGQTIGKRIFHVRVATLTGAPVTGRQVAIRNLLRLADALPIFYASGLLSVMRTGRARRQRIGDVVAGTTVLVDADGTPLSTPRWLLPAATILATVASIAVILPILNNRRQPSIPVRQGFEGARGTSNLDKLILRPAQVGPGYKLRVPRSGRALAGTAALKLCYVTFQSEALRTARIMGFYLKVPFLPEKADLTNQVVAYRPGGAQQAMQELRYAASHCPPAHTIVGAAGVKQITYHITPIADRRLPAGYLALRTDTSGLMHGQPWAYTDFLVYQTRSNLLSVIFAQSNALRVALHAAEESARNLRWY